MKARLWVWVAYAISLAWVGTVLVFVQGYLTDVRRESFRREGGRLVEAWANSISQAEPGSPAEGTLLRRWSGEGDVRGLAIVEEDGTPRKHEGTLVTGGRPTDRGADFVIAGEGWVFVSPVWRDGRRDGQLVWLREMGTLRSARGRDRNALFAAWGWWALAGGIGAVVVAHRL